MPYTTGEESGCLGGGRLGMLTAGLTGVVAREADAIDPMPRNDASSRRRVESSALSGDVNRAPYCCRCDASARELAVVPVKGATRRTADCGRLDGDGVAPPLSLLLTEGGDVNLRGDSWLVTMVSIGVVGVSPGE